MNLKNKTVLVTDADGFIGSHLIERLIELVAHVGIGQGIEQTALWLKTRLSTYDIEHYHV